MEWCTCFMDREADCIRQILMPYISLRFSQMKPEMVRIIKAMLDKAKMNSNSVQPPEDVTVIQWNGQKGPIWQCTADVISLILNRLQHFVKEPDAIDVCSETHSLTKTRKNHFKSCVSLRTMEMETLSFLLSFMSSASTILVGSKHLCHGIKTTFLLFMQHSHVKHWPDNASCLFRHISDSGAQFIRLISLKMSVEREQNRIIT